MEDKVKKTGSFNIDISSTTADKAIDGIKDFLGKLISPAIEEAGLLIKDNITFWRFKNQVKMVGKAKALAEKYNINPKTIPLKLVLPLLENAGLEEEEFLQDKWALLLTNMVDSKQNIANHVLPYLLSQLSKEEFEFIETQLNEKRKLIELLATKLKDYEAEREKKIKYLTLEISKTETLLKLEKDEIPVKDEMVKIYNDSLNEYNQELIKLNNYDGTISIKRECGVNAFIQIDNLQKFELVNLTRLGIIKEVPKPFAKVSPTNGLFGYTNYSQVGYGRKANIKVDIVTSEFVYSITELGEKLIDACSETNL